MTTSHMPRPQAGWSCVRAQNHHFSLSLAFLPSASFPSLLLFLRPFFHFSSFFSFNCNVSSLSPRLSLRFHISPIDFSRSYQLSSLHTSSYLSAIIYLLALISRGKFAVLFSRAGVSILKENESADARKGHGIIKLVTMQFIKRRMSSDILCSLFSI